MADMEQLAFLKEDTRGWNDWRKENFSATIDLVDADLSRADLSGADLSRADLSGADLFGAKLSGADLREANLHGANLSRTDLREVHLSGADLVDADLSRADLSGADLVDADLSGANLGGAKLGGAYLKMARLSGANLNGTDLRRANLSEADLRGASLRASLDRADLGMADLSEADLHGASLRGANLSRTDLINANFEGADLTDSRIFGISAWNVKLEGATQKNLVITEDGEPTLTVDDLEVAQFIYMLLNNQKIKNVIDTITSKAVLILGRFTEERKTVLEAIREELRRHGYVPILFDFEPSASRDLTETVTLLARMARFIIADLTDPKSIPQELTSIIPDLPSVPVQPIILSSQREYAMYEHWRRYPWVQAIQTYDAVDDLLAGLGDRVIAPSERAIEKSKARSKAAS